MVLYSTFLTRSGILGDTSVHTFTDLGLSGQLLALFFVYLFFIQALFVSRIRDEIDLEPRLDEVESLYRQVNRKHAPLADRATRTAWASDLDRVARNYAGHHLAHWRSIAEAADAGGQSSEF